MIYKEFIAETAQKIMAEQAFSLFADKLTPDSEKVEQLAKSCIAAAKVLADALEEDYKQQPVDGGVFVGWDDGVETATRTVDPGEVSAVKALFK
jgi:hypothetical protein